MDKGAQQRAHLLDVARDLFAEKGYEATTTRALNQAAGTSDGLLYYYFPHGKQDLLDTIVKEGLTQRVNALAVDFSAVHTKAQLEGQLVTMIEEIWQLFAREDNYQSFIITVRERMLLSEVGSDWVLQYTEQLEKRLLQALVAVGPQLALDEPQLPVLVSVIAALVITPLFSELLLRNQRTLGEQQLAVLQQQVHLVVSAA
ncbi:TetR/AcrR family transcriptional regulator [Lacticaseibacillus baoqingensis]|uniref:TetR/AcrR family transcriptional regulator n=1 Tax=Lacticaseibacillus baoqingensis TaxID=2486013 RepID=A0ABW4E439_9LACO|nr:TetR/AcrR family transcriptional regulator [Lacticaseibacillus baoqingensis]